MKQSPEKCHLIQQEATFIGHVLSREGIRIEDSKIKAVQSLAPDLWKNFSNSWDLQIGRGLSLEGLQQWVHPFKFMNYSKREKILTGLVNVRKVLKTSNLL